MNKYRLVIITSITTIVGKFHEYTKQEYQDLEEWLMKIAEYGKTLNLQDNYDRSWVLSEPMIKSSIFYLEPSETNEENY